MLTLVDSAAKYKKHIESTAKDYTSILALCQLFSTLLTHKYIDAIQVLVFFLLSNNLMYQISFTVILCIYMCGSERVQ